MSDDKNRKNKNNQNNSLEKDFEHPDYSSSGSNRWVVHVLIIMVFDAILIAFSYYVALLMRFDFVFSHIGKQYVAGFNTLIVPYIVIAICIFWYFHLYHSIWRFASMSELGRMVEAWAVDQAAVALLYFFTGIRMPIGFWIVGAVLGFTLTTALRFSLYFIRAVKRMVQQKAEHYDERVMVIGAGSAARTIISELIMSSHLSLKVCCIIDDNPIKKGRYLNGIPIVGNRNMIVDAAKKYHITQIIYAIPSATAVERKEILKICSNTGCKVRAIPGIYQLVDGAVSVSKLKDVQIEDLLGREQVKVNLDEVHSFVHGKVVMVTGGGGSIGSELCRQIAKDGPKMLIIFDIYENNAYEIQMELKRKYGDKLNLVTLIGSVRNSSRVNWIMKKYQPEIIYHAAAHKHVPLMEDSPNEAIKNNVMGTYNLAVAAIKNNVHRFVLISTDKAVNPTNIMGASKRLCEMVVQMMNRKSLVNARALAKDGVIPSHTEFVAVRFGNVLGSNGSVIPLFKEQIAAGGPVTVTDKNIIRYFMTIPEAVSLVLQASYYAKGGEIFVLDMGDPVRIDDMARNLIRLSGYVPDVDIKIVYTGLRPGEKLYEEMLMSEEGLKETPNKLIHIGEPIQMDDRVFEEQLQKLDRASASESGHIKELVAEVVPTYHPDMGNQEVVMSKTDAYNFNLAQQSQTVSS